MTRQRQEFKTLARQHEETIIEHWLLAEFGALGPITQRDRDMVRRLAAILPDLIFED